LITHPSVRGRGARLYSAAVAALMTIGFLATQTAAGQDASVSVNADQRLAYGDALTVRGQVSGEEPRSQVKLLYAPSGQDFKTVDTARTGDRGGYVLRHRPIRTGTMRVLTGGATTSRTRTVKVGARVVAAEREHVKIGDRATVAGRLKPGYRGRTILIQQRKQRHWVTVDRDRTARKGRFVGSWRVERGAGRYRTRVVFRGDRRNAPRVDNTRLFVYRAGQASYYGPGLYGNRTACGQTLTPSTVGVANRWLPCGTRVTFRYHGRSVTAPVIDRGPYSGSRIWDLTYATKQRLGFGSTGVVWSTK
jgi:rare lipoprotein A